MGTFRKAQGGKKSPLKALLDLQQAAISGRALKLFLILRRKGQVLNCSGQTVSMQYEFSATMKSARVRYPRTNPFSPIYLLRSSNLLLYFCSTSTLAVSCSLLKKSILTAPAISLKMERKHSNLALSWLFFPRSSHLPQRLMMQFMMADDSVMLQSPSMRQGRLGKFRLSCTLSSPNHFACQVQRVFSNYTPEQARRRRGTCASPRIPQQPSFTSWILGEMGAIGGRKVPLTASGRWQYALISGRASKLWRMRHQKGQLTFSLGQSVSKQQRFSAKQKSARVRYPSANEFSPIQFLRASNLGLNFSNRSIFKLSQSLFQKSALISFMESLITPTRLLTCPRS